MLAYIRGVLARNTGEYVILDVQGMGYHIAVCESMAELGSLMLLHIVEVIREDKYDLYGFLSEDTLALFEALTSVQGVGPKLGIKILSAGNPDAVRRAILAGDISFFTGISGVGKKTAQKIILDLQGILVSGNDALHGGDQEIYDALIAFGYTKEAIRETLPHIQGETVEDKIKACLRMLGKTA